MHSLSAHLRDPDNHGRLAFHADCPICRRERLVGVLPSEPIVSRRTQALLATGVLALSAAAPTAVAAEPDQEQEGSAVPEQLVGGDPADSPGFDPGGDSTALPFDDRPPPHAQASPSPNGDDTEPLDEEPAKDIDAPIVDAGDEAAGPTAQEQVSAPAQPAPPPPPPEQPPGPSELPLSAAAPEPPAVAPTPPPEEPDRAQTRKRQKPTGVEPRKRTVTEREPSAVTPTSVAAVEPAQPPPAVSTPVGPGAGSRAEPGDRVHVVHTGESLWSISSDLLGDETSAARIAREVHKLWALNKERIGTGDPDLVMVGTRLRLR